MPREGRAVIGAECRADSVFAKFVAQLPRYLRSVGEVLKLEWSEEGNRYALFLCGPSPFLEGV